MVESLKKTARAMGLHELRDNSGKIGAWGGTHYQSDAPRIGSVRFDYADLTVLDYLRTQITIPEQSRRGPCSLR